MHTTSLFPGAIRPLFLNALLFLLLSSVYFVWTLSLPRQYLVPRLGEKNNSKPSGGSGQLNQSNEDEDQIVPFNISNMELLEEEGTTVDAPGATMMMMEHDQEQRPTTINTRNHDDSIIVPPTPPSPHGSSSWLPSDDDDEWLQQCVQRETKNTLHFQKEYQPQWPQYQLGDCLKMCKWCEASIKRSKLKKASIAGQYWANVCHKEESFESFNVTFLAELFRKYELDPHPYTQPWPRPAEDELVIHLRIGDIVDEPKYSGNVTVLEMLRNGADTRHGWHSFYRNGIKSVSEYLTTIQESGLTKVVLRGGSHFPKVYPKSRIFTACLVEAIEKAGFNITSLQVDGESNADQDFFYMSHAKHFVMATGGYSRLISQMVEHFGGRVVGRYPNATKGASSSNEKRFKSEVPS